MNRDKQRKPATNSDHIICGLSEKKAKNRPLMASYNPGGLLLIFVLKGLLFLLAFTLIMMGYIYLGLIILAYSLIFFIWKCIQIDLPQNSTNNYSVRYVSGTEWNNKNNHYSSSEYRARDIQRLSKAKLSNSYQPKLKGMTARDKVTNNSTIVTALIVEPSLVKSVTFSDNDTSISHDFVGNNYEIQEVAFPDSAEDPFDDNNQTLVNPANSSIMIGGMGGLDMEGNAYGTDNDSMITTVELFEDSTSFVDDSMTGIDDSFSSMDDSWSSNDDF